MTEKININIVTHNGQKYLPGCFESILKQTFRDFSVLVIDNNSQDGSLELIEKIVEKHHWKILKNKKNLGFAEAHNQGLRATRAVYVLILNQDVILEINFLAKALKFLDEHSRAGALTGKLLRLTRDGKSDIIDSLGLKVFRSRRVSDRSAGEIDKGQFVEVEQVFGASGAAPIYRRRALENIKQEVFVDKNKKKIDYFDSDFFAFKEDVDLAYRLKKKGWLTYYVPTVVAYHYRSAKTAKNLSLKETLKKREKRNRQINYYSYRNHLFCLVKNLDSRTLWKNFPFIFSFEIVKFIYLLFCEPVILFKALRDFRKLWPKMWLKRKI